MKGNWDKTTWMARGEFDLSDSVLLYLSHGTGWKSGVLQDGMGFAQLDDGTGNLDFSRNNALLQDPEEVESTELGVKTDFANWRLSANLFYMDFTDMQVTGAVIDPVTGQSTLTNTNAGGATIQGARVRELGRAVRRRRASSTSRSPTSMRPTTSSSATRATSATRAAASGTPAASASSRAAPAPATCSTSPATTCRMRRSTRRR